MSVGWKGIGVGAAWIVGAGGAALFVFGLSFYAALKYEMRATEVSVPDLTGLTREEAARVARASGLVIDVADERHDLAMSSGRILQQEPRGGASVRRGRKVKVVLSLGGKVLEVPVLLGRASRAVEIELARAGFGSGGEARIPADAAAPGTVLAQVPPPGSPAVPGSRIHRLVSDGPVPRQWVMPDLTGRPRRTAEAWIEQCGFRRGAVRTVPAGDRPPGTVVGQLPLAGYPISSRGVVDLTVAR